MYKYYNKNIMIKRCIHIGIFIIIILCILLFRITYYVLFKSKSISVIQQNQYSYIEKTSELNYNLVDCNGNNLLNFKTKYYAVIDPLSFDENYFDKAPEVIDSLKYILKNYNSNYKLPNADTTESKKIYYEINENSYNLISKLKLKGLYAYEYSCVDRSEYYKIENVITNTKKSIDNSDKSKNCLEMKIHNLTLKDDFSKVILKKDINGLITNINKKSSNSNVITTIDKGFEDKIQNVLSNDKYSAYKQIGAVLMESNNGEIKAAVQKDYDEPDVLLGGVGNGFEPGSIFKTIVEEAALEKGCINASQKFTSKDIYDSEKKTIGTFSLDEAYMKSINDIFAQIGNKTGFPSILKMAQNQGILSNEKVLGIDDEKTGAYAKPSGYGELSLFSIGQNMQITPIQALSIPNTIVNDGIYVKPHILKIDNPQGKKVISSNTASIIKNQMSETVKNNGTGKNADISGVEMGGKTGTSTRMQQDTNGKLQKHSDGWFAGFFKSNNKYYSLIVYVKDIDASSDYASTTSAPLFKDIVAHIIEK